MSDETKDYGCSASVTFTIRVTGNGHWGAKATVEEVMQQGGRETVNAVMAALRETGLQFEVVGKPKVGAVTWGPSP